MDRIDSTKLVQDMQAVVVDAEELLKATAGQAGERIEKARARATESLRIARERIAVAGNTVESQVREHPWAAAGIAAGVGLLVGLLIGRRD